MYGRPLLVYLLKTIFLRSFGPTKYFRNFQIFFNNKVCSLLPGWLESPPPTTMINSRKTMNT